MTLVKLVLDGFVRLTHPVRRLTALALATIVLATGGLSSPRPRPETATGFITSTGIVNIDGLPTVSGQTLFSASDISTSENSAASIELRNLVRLRLAAKTHLALEFSSQNVLSSLHEGQIVASIPAGVQVHIMTADASLLTEGSEPVAFTISTDGCITFLSVQTGAATLRVGDKAHSIAAGEEFSTAPGSQATPQKTSNRKKRIGLVIGIGATVAVLIAVLAGNSNRDPGTSTPGGCVIAPSGPTTGTPDPCT
jgi:ferric-dicitrate binding protein FerR (iron transport regulator)